MRILVASLLFCLITAPALAGNVLPYKAWKARRVSEAKSVSGQFGRELKQLKRKDADKTLIATQKARYQQSKINVEIAQELSATDYFVLYLSRQFKGQKKAYIQAAKKMSRAEIADIMMSYQKLLDEHKESPALGAPSASLLIPLIYGKSQSSIGAKRPNNL